jgi:hypothetical protein
MAQFGQAGKPALPAGAGDAPKTPATALLHECRACENMAASCRRLLLSRINTIVIQRDRV